MKRWENRESRDWRVKSQKVGFRASKDKNVEIEEWRDRKDSRESEKKRMKKERRERRNRERLEIEEECH